MIMCRLLDMLQCSYKFESIHIKKFAELCYYVAAGIDYVNINVLILYEILLQNACIFFSKLATQFSSLVSSKATIQDNFALQFCWIATKFSTSNQA